MDVLSGVDMRNEDREKVEKIQSYMEIYEKTMKFIVIESIKTVSESIDNSEISYKHPSKIRQDNVILSKCY